MRFTFDDKQREMNEKHKWITRENVYCAMRS